MCSIWGVLSARSCSRASGTRPPNRSPSLASLRWVHEIPKSMPGNAAHEAVRKPKGPAEGSKLSFLELPPGAVRS